MAPLIHIIIEETRKTCKKQPVACGFNPSDNAYQPLKLMQTVMAKTNEICMRYMDNSLLCSLPPPGAPGNPVSVCAVRNKRKKMEDRHAVIPDLNVILNLQDASPSSYYAIFDGHAGVDAAAYSAAHLHQYLAESKNFVSNPEQALLDAFCKTDALFVEKCNVERFSSGTTAVVALHRPKENFLYVAWVGDSQALLVNQGRILQCVHPHKPSREDEKKRIEELGGYVSYYGTWRVNGQLAVSRAIGDLEYKPFVSAVPDIRAITLDGGEDFLILACDGLWDFLSEDEAAQAVYKMVCECPDNTDPIGERLVQLSKANGSGDNISVIVVLLREPAKIAAEGARWANCTMDASLDNVNNPFANSNGASSGQKTDGLLLDLSASFEQAEQRPDPDFFQEKTNGTKVDDFDDEDLGPETDVDAVDDIFSPTIAAAKALVDGLVNNNPEGGFNPFSDKLGEEEKDIDLEDLQKKQEGDFEEERRLAREETPTPPADIVHGGLEDNLADSGEDSEDEWNYIKGEEADKENLNPLQPDQEVARILEESDNMSQLNPNAAEFVPVSPTNSAPSPVCRALMDDPVIAQSPSKPSEIDIKLPDPQDFEDEVKSRPSEIAESNGHCEDHDGDDHVDKTSPVQQQNPFGVVAMDDFLTDDLSEQRIAITPTKVQAPQPTDEFHFGPNAAPFTPAKQADQSEISTQAVYGDESTATLGLSLNESDFVPNAFNKESDPMSMSFYQERGDGVDPFDLNQVQILPDNLEDFLGKPDQQQTLIDTTSSGDNEIVQTTDLDKGVEEDVALIGNVCEIQTENLICDLSAPEVCRMPAKEPEALSRSPDSTNQDEIVVCQTPEAVDQSSPLQPLQVEESLGSPVDDITSSVKDSVSPVIRSPLPEEETRPIEASSPVFGAEMGATPESVATVDVHSFVESTRVPEVASPLSPHEKEREPSPVAILETITKTENLIPELAEPTIVVTPTEEPTKIETEIPVVEVAPIVEKKTPAVKSSKTGSTNKKATPVAATNKVPPAKSPAARPRAAVPAKTASPLKPAVPKTTVAAKSGVAPRTGKLATGGATAKVGERKPLTNGDVKTTVSSTAATARRTVSASATSARSTATKTSTTATKPFSTATGARPITAPARSTAAKLTSATGATSTVPKPRPNTLASRAPLAAAKSATTTKTTLTKVLSPKAPTPPRPRPTTAPAKPRVPLTRTVPKSTADAEKQSKESANKLTASRTTSTRTSSTATALKASSAVRKTEARTVAIGSTRTIVSKTTSTSAKSTTTTTTGSAGGKKPLEITRNVKTKTTKIEKPLQNGVSTVVTEQITVVNNGVVESLEPQLLKDNSPLDNKLLVEANAAD